MLIILAPITGGVRCGYSSTGPIKKKEKKKRENGGGGGGWSGGGWILWGGGGGVTLSSFSVWYPWLKSVKDGGLHYFHG